MDRQEAALAVVAVLERELLSAMDHVDRIIDVERYRRGWDGVTRAIEVEQRSGQTDQFARSRRVLPTAHGRLAGQPERITRQFAERQLETRIMAQGIEIIGVFIRARDRQLAGTQDVGDTVDHPTLIARISDAGDER